MEESSRWYDERYHTVHWCAASGIWPCLNCITEENGKEKTDRWCGPAQGNGKNKLKHAKGCPCIAKDPDNPDADNRGGERERSGRKKKVLNPLEEAVENHAEVVRLKLAVEEQQQILNSVITERPEFKELSQLKADLKLAREKAALEFETEGDLVEGVVPDELRVNIGFLVLLELGRMAVSSSVFQAFDPDMGALSLFARLLTARVRMLGAYFGWCTIEEVEAHTKKMNVETGWLYRRCGPPYRFLCKTSIHLATMVSHLDLPDLLFTCAAYRLYWNSPEAWEGFVREYHEGSGEMGLPIASFAYGKFLKVVNAVEDKRNGAYLMGCKGKRGLAEKLANLKDFITNLVNHFGVLPEGQSPDKERSTLILRTMQRGLSHFHGLQLFLDAGFFCKGFCTPSLVLECGPGAADAISKIFPILGDRSGKMSRNRAVEVACAPFFEKLSDMLADPKVDAGKDLREAVSEFKFPQMGPDHLQYFACEKRQWWNRMSQEAMAEFPSAWKHSYMAAGVGLRYFIEAMPESRFNPHVDVTQSAFATPQAASSSTKRIAKKSSFVGRELGKTNSHAADPPKRLQKDP